jgi:hypothetical protein
VIEAGFQEIEGDVDLVLSPLTESQLDLANVRGDMEFVGAAREIWLETDEGRITSMPGIGWLLLHYPQYEVGGLDEREFGIFRWNDETERWIFAGGTAGPETNTLIVAGIEDLGRYGVFHWEGLGFGDSRGLAGVLAEPNPFSPNGDGVYDKTTISFYLGREADHVNLEIYDLQGRLVRRLFFRLPATYTGRTPVILDWDGTAGTEGRGGGEVVPYGIYILRVEAKFKTEPTYERVNIPLVVIK